MENAALLEQEVRARAKRLGHEVTGRSVGEVLNEWEQQTERLMREVEDSRKRMAEAEAELKELRSP